MNVNSIDNSNFGARFMNNPTTQRSLESLKKYCLSHGLSPQIYEKEFAKIHKIFPSDDVVVSLVDSSKFYNAFLLGINNGRNCDSMVFCSEYAKPEKYLVAELISACKKIAERMAEK